MDEPLIGYDGPTLIPYASVTRHVWGDAEAGEVSDWTFLSTDKLTQLLFGMPPHGAFRHSENFKTIFAADELYFVLSGELVLANPATGEIARAHPGEAIFFQRDTWHHGFNHSDEPLHVIEYFAPSPAQGTGAAYARQQPNLESVRYVQNEWVGQWIPPHTARNQTMCVIREHDRVLCLDDGMRGITNLLVSTSQLTVGVLELLPGQHTSAQIHGGDEGVYVLSGQPQIQLPSATGTKWFELQRGDGFYIPSGVSRQYYNLSNRPISLL